MKYVVRTNETDLRIRAAPDPDAPVVGKLDRGYEFDFVDEPESVHADARRPWVRPTRWRRLAPLAPGQRPSGMRLNAGRSSGWVCSEYLLAPDAHVAPHVAPPRHLLIFIGGYLQSFRPEGPPTAVPRRWVMLPGSTMTQVDPHHGTRRSCQDAFEALQARFRAPSWSVALNPDRNADLRNPAILRALALIGERADPAGMLVLCGFSAGAFHVLRLAEAMERELPQRRVELLVTIDACWTIIDPTEQLPVGRPLRCVDKHVNFYQRSDVEYKGRPMNHLPSDRNIRCDSRVGGLPADKRHDAMPRVTQADVLRLVGELLESPAGAAGARST